MFFFKKKKELAWLDILAEGHALSFYASAVANREYIRPWMNWLTPSFSPAEAYDLIIQSKKSHRIGEGYWYAIMFNNLFAGCAVYSRFSKMEHSAEISYWVDQKFAGQGLAVRSAHALVAHAFNQPSISDIEIRCAVANERSQKIPLRLGFSADPASKGLADYMGGEWRPIIRYMISRKEWERLHRQKVSFPTALPIRM